MKYLTLLVFLGISLLCEAQQDSIVPFEKAYKRTYNIRKVSGVKPTIDGKLDEDFWTKQGEWSDRFVQIIPYERAITQSPTRVKLFYDDKYIYVGVYCKDAVPDKMNRFIGNRDDNSLGDLISVAFDTYHDYRAAPEFNINLGGNKTDLVVTDKLNVNLSWNAVWEGRTNINRADSSWTAELRIPFSQLRYNQRSEDGVWGLHVRRIIRRNNEVQNWSMIPLKNNGHVFSFGNMSGMDSVPKPRGIEFLPYVMGKYRQEPRIDGSPYQKGYSWGGNVGLDAKFALSDYTLDMTINPDYGQVELDPSVMNLTAYETFYDEKRPFFLEGKHILDFANGSDMMFYTRRIGASPSYTPRGIDNVGSYAETKENVPIIGALKLTGTNKRGLTIGVIESVTARSSSKVTRNGVEDVEVVEPLTNYTVARVQKNWKGNTLLGGMVTSVNRALDQPYLEDFMVRNAFTAGIDFTQYFKNRLYYIDVKGMLSSLHGSAGAITALQNSVAHYYQRASSADYLGVDPTRRSLTGTGGYVKVGRKGNAKWNFSETFTWSSPGFDLNDMGYMKETDYLMNETEIMYRQTDIWKIFRYNAFTLSQKNMWNYGGTPFSNNASLRWQSMTMNRYEWDVKETFAWNWLDSRLLRGGPDGRIDSNDEYNLLSENGTPRINYGFGGSIKWKGITLDVHFQGVGKYDRFVGGVDGGFYQHGGTIRPYFPIWTSDKVYDPELNPDGVYPRITGTSWYESGAGNTSYWMRNGAYLRLKNLNIGYDLPMAILRPLGITHAQVFANATNLFCISAVTEFLDPEQEYYDSYPLMRTFSFGLNFSF